MGEIKDNMMMLWHRQDGQDLPDVTLRLHRGNLGEDFETTITYEQVVSLVGLAAGPLPQFRAKLIECAPEFCARLRETAYSVYRQLFLDLRGLRAAK